MGWIHLRQDRNMWQAVVKTAINYEFYKLWVVSRLVEELVAYQVLLCSMQLVNIIWTHMLVPEWKWYMTVFFFWNRFFVIL